jgi:hypothetical protein
LKKVRSHAGPPPGQKEAQSLCRELANIEARLGGNQDRFSILIEIKYEKDLIRKLKADIH